MTNVAAFLLGWGMYSGFVLIPQYVQTPESTGYGFGLSVTKAGLFLLPWSGAMLVASAISTRLAAHGGAKLPLTTGAIIGVAGFGFLLAEHAREWELLVASGLIGTGVGLAFASLANVVIELVPQTETSVATGVNIIARTIGGVVGTQVGVSVVAATVASSDFPTRAGYLWVFAMSAAASASPRSRRSSYPDARKPALLPQRGSDHTAVSAAS